LPPAVPHPLFLFQAIFRLPELEDPRTRCVCALIDSLGSPTFWRKKALRLFFSSVVVVLLSFPPRRAFFPQHRFSIICIVMWRPPFPRVSPTMVRIRLSPGLPRDVAFNQCFSRQKSPFWLSARQRTFFALRFSLYFPTFQAQYLSLFPKTFLLSPHRPFRRPPLMMILFSFSPQVFSLPSAVFFSSRRSSPTLSASEAWYPRP